MQTQYYGDNIIKLDDDPKWEAERLEALATVLRDNHMPQETVNMVLAAHCGLPMEKVDPKSMYFRWEDELATTTHHVMSQEERTGHARYEEREHVFRCVSDLLLTLSWGDAMRVLCELFDDRMIEYSSDTRTKDQPSVLRPLPGKRNGISTP